MGTYFRFKSFLNKSPRTVMKFSVLIFICIISVKPQTTVAQQEGLTARIENPQLYFGDQRRNWIDQTIYFLRIKTLDNKNPYFDWCFDPSDMRGSKADAKELQLKYGKIEEVWSGKIHLTKPNRDYWHAGFFWKVRLLHNNKTIYFWDDNKSAVSNFGFVKDYDHARRHVGKTLWNKSRDNLYEMDNSSAISLKNLEQVKLTDVQWGEFGNFPLKFIITTELGKTGYYLEKKYDRFIEEWYISDPRKKFPNWSYRDWELLEKRLLQKKMSKDMVLISWGNPSKIETKYDEKGTGFEIWTYQGVKKTTYYLRFLNNSLHHVNWDEKK